MKTIRRGVFETNSSSTHSVTIMDLETYKKWENGEICYNFSSNSAQTFEERAREICEEVEIEYTGDDIKDYLSDFLIDNKSEFGQSYEEYFDDLYLELDVNFYTTKSGDEIAIICEYGNNY